MLQEERGMQIVEYFNLISSSRYIKEHLMQRNRVRKIVISRHDHPKFQIEGLCNGSDMNE